MTLRFLTISGGFAPGYNNGGVSQHTYAQTSTTSYSRDASFGGGDVGAARGGGGGDDSSSSSSSEDERDTRRPGLGGLSLHDLNNKLEKYIRDVQLSPDGPGVSISVMNSR